MPIILGKVTFFPSYLGLNQQVPLRVHFVVAVLYIMTDHVALAPKSYMWQPARPSPSSPHSSPGPQSTRFVPPCSVQPALSTAHSTRFPHQSLAFSPVFPLPFDGTGHQHHPKVKSFFLGSNSSFALFQALCSALHVTAEGKTQVEFPHWLPWKLSSSQRTDFIAPTLQRGSVRSPASSHPGRKPVSPLPGAAPSRAGLPNAAPGAASCPPAFAAPHEAQPRARRGPWATAYSALFESSVGLRCIFFPSHKLFPPPREMPVSVQRMLEKQTVLQPGFWKLLVNSCTWFRVYFVLKWW